MDREQQIIDAGVEFQMSRHPIALGGDNFYNQIREYNRNNSFEAGAKWADNNPSDKVIKNILSLAWEYNASDIDVNNLTPEGEFEYVKNNINR